MARTSLDHRAAMLGLAFAGCLVEGAVLTPSTEGSGGSGGEGPVDGGHQEVTTGGGTEASDDEVGCDPTRVSLCPEPGVTWQYQLQGVVDTTVAAELFVVDLFDIATGDVDDLHAAGRGVICSFGAGNHESWRPDADAFPAGAIGALLEGYDDERWLDLRDPTVRMVLAERMDLAVDKRCDGVEPANVEAYLHDSGFDLTAEDQLDFNLWLAEQAHLRGLSVGLSGDLPQLAALLDAFDWALTVGCFVDEACDELAPFLDAGMAVLSVEYVADEADGPELAASICDDANARQLSTIIKRDDLEAWLLPC